MKAEPQAEHRWLEQLLGAWTYEAECNMGPGKPPAKNSGRETVRSLGGLWIVAEGLGTMPGGGEATTILTLGYDAVEKRYKGTWIGSMMAKLWLYDGTLDAAGKVLTLDSEGPSFAGDGTTARYQDIVEIVGPDHRIFRSQTPGPDGGWNQFMVAHYRRQGV